MMYSYHYCCCLASRPKILAVACSNLFGLLSANLDQPAREGYPEPEGDGAYECV